MKTKMTMTAGKTAKVTGIFALAFGLILSSCNKQPSADFTTDKTEYTAGETVKLSNTSLDAKTYKWTFPDGQTSALENIDYTLSSNTPAGVYSIKLEAISKKGNKKSEASKSITVRAFSVGQLTVWTSNSGVNQITVKVDNVTLGTITAYYNANPGCGASNCVTQNLSVGTHTLTATDGTFNWSGTITITANNCLTYQLQ